MRKNIGWAIVVVAAALIQTTWLNALRLEGVLPDLVLLLVVYFAMADGEERAMFTGVLGGIYEDVAGNAVLGHHVLCNVIVGFLVARVAHRLILEHPVIQVVLVVVSSLLNGFLYITIQYVQTPGMQAVHAMLTSVVPAAFYTALVTLPAFFLLRRTFHRHETALV